MLKIILSFYNTKSKYYNVVYFLFLIKRNLLKTFLNKYKVFINNMFIIVRAWSLWQSTAGV